MGKLCMLASSLEVLFVNDKQNFVTEMWQNEYIHPF